MARPKTNSPHAKMLMNSMRSMGYTFESAIADVIDNSISADAKNIKVVFPSEPSNCFIAIVDDGFGMSEDELYNAMKYGSNSLNDRENSDLGRFGLGLKSASLSQCKKLTVISKKNNKISGYVWDIDKIEDEWLIFELEDDEIASTYGFEDISAFKSGTVVVWEKFDIIEKSTGDVFYHLNELKNEVSNYIALIYHRYLNGEVGVKRTIKINEYSIIGLDPFLQKHNKTDRRREASIALKDSKGVERLIYVKPFVLPYQKDLSTEDKKLIGGIESYNNKQGFYIYRNYRLIIWGTWFRMKPRHELTKQARIMVDIPNSLDDIWSIDIKKQNAELPKIIRAQLIKLVEDVMGVALKSQKHRGRLLNSENNIDYIWIRNVLRDKKYKYVLNRNSKIFDILRDVDDQIIGKFNYILDEIEESIPYQQIYLDMSEQNVNNEIDDERIAEIKNKALIMVRIAQSISNRNIDDILNDLFLSEPFCNFLPLKDDVKKEVENGNK